ncbi:MAG TPA: hypothetical protein VE090_00905 [Methylomirabilota bacterium]|nr:hypothetical protein [Methylomirabilota bacterium]
MSIINNKQIIKLKKLFEEHFVRAFPHISYLNDELQDIKGEIALYDGHIAGLISSYFKKGPINRDLIKVDSELEIRLQNFHPQNSQEEKSLKDLTNYKHKVDEIASTLLNLIG